jgi:membrane peptidoglycan carboxypeptidase
VQNTTMSDEIRRAMTEMLCSVIESGTGTAARLPGRDAGGKTGTTQEYRDAWFVGFTADYVGGVWIGNDDNRPMRKVTGGTVPAQVWKAVMLAAEARMPARALERSPGLPVGMEPEEVAVTGYTDDPMSGPPMIDDASPGSAAVVSIAPAPVVSTPVSANSVEQARTEQTGPIPAPQAAPDAAVVRVPYQGQHLPAPMTDSQAPVSPPSTLPYRP